MALIKCPECQKEISDKAQCCVNCGYPINSQKVIIENINGKDYDVSFLLYNNLSQATKIKKILDMTGCNALIAKNIVLKYHPTNSISNSIKEKNYQPNNLSKMQINQHSNNKQRIFNSHRICWLRFSKKRVPKMWFQMET